MSNRSDEVTESRDTDDLLEETDRLLSDAGFEAADAEPSPSAATDQSDVAAGAAHDRESTTASSRLAGLRSWLAVDTYFSPKAFVAFVLLLGAGLFAGATVIPIAGRIIGILGVAFTIGLLSSKRRYLELTAAGTAVGAVSAVASHAFLAVAGSFQAVVAVGVTVGLVASLVGYYFGRDLRDGLTREI
ncbi:DUF456 domain-containing protein [Natronorubrum aibiense]|uniref:DUF456 domain-containing protein n=2 Tax=Natronorubrum aibiense TaxID=348826 RepID=A0A5P9P7G8_9EURY|nr:DUF456 domain-containing protein [Natronorubrum aibiense]QFU84083.1 DUF456 domain-containing protein [Natronorubrum aibiense]